MKTVSTIGDGNCDVDASFIESIFALNSAGARYMVIGGAALLLHGFQRKIRDYDIWLDGDGDNVVPVQNAFAALGASFLGFELDDLVRQNALSPIVETIYTFSPHPIDFRLRAHGPTFRAAYPNRQRTNWGADVIAVNDLANMKSETLRPIDEFDIALIRSKYKTQ